MFRSILILSVMASFAGWVRADFMIDPNPDGAKFFNGDANKDVSSFTGNVGGQNSGPLVTVTTVGNVDTGAGFSTIVPIKDGTLTSVTFTPADDLLFDSFAFRGQLLADAGGTVTVVVVNQLDVSQTFTFSGLPSAPADFAGPDGLGIIAVALSGQTIKSVTLLSDFKEEKQNHFGFAPGGQPTPGPGIPVPAAVWGGLGLLGLLGVRQTMRRA